MTGMIAALEKDTETAKVHPKSDGDAFVGMELGGKVYTEKEDAGKAIIEACKGMNSPDPIPLGKYRGFELLLAFNTHERTYEVNIKGATTQTAELGDDIFGNITRIDNRIERFEMLLEVNRRSLDEANQQLETAKAEVEKPFSREDELKEKTARLDELNILLSLDKRENEFAEDEPGEDEAEPERKVVGLER